MLIDTGTKIELILSYWTKLKPTFMWIPTHGKWLVTDRVRGIVGKQAGTKTLASGGMRNLVVNSSTDWIRWDTNAGISTGTSNFFGLMVVTAPSTSGLGGAVIKIGDTATGIACGAGGATMESPSTTMKTLLEGIAWGNAAGSFVSGLNVISFAWTTDNYIRMNNASTATNALYGRPAGYSAPTQELSIQGYTTNRGSNLRVHAAAIFNQALSGSEFDDLSFGAGKRLESLYRAPVEYVEKLFKQRRIFVPMTAATASVPTLSASTYVPGSLTSTGWRPRITAS